MFSSLINKITSAYNEQIYTKNMFVVAHYELGLSLFDKDITADKINTAYEKLLDEYVTSVQNGLNPPFDITNKKEAKDYLIKFNGLNE